MKKIGFAEILTILAVIIGGIMVILHPQMWEEVASTLVGAIIIIAFFIGYGDND